MNRVRLALLALVVAAAARNVAGQSLPRAIRESDLPRIESVLMLSEAQREAVGAILKSMDDQFQPDFQAQRRAMIKEREHLVLVLNQPDKIPEKTTALATWKSAERLFASMRATVVARNEEVLSRIQEILIPAQRERLPILRWHLERLALAQPLTAIREQNVDLIAICERMTTLEGQEYAYVTATGESMLPSFVSCLQNLARARDSVFELDAQVADLQRPFSMLNMAPPPEVANEIEELYRQWGKETLPASKSLIANNRAMLSQLCAGLSAQHAAEVRRRYNEKSYPEIWPDPAESSYVYAQVKSLGDLNREQSEFIAAFENTYNDQHARLSQSMAKAIYDRGILWVTRPPDALLHVDAFNDELRRLGLERERLNLRQAELLASILLPHQLELLPVLRQEQPDPPRPWDIGGKTIRLRSAEHASERAPSGASPQGDGVASQPDHGPGALPAAKPTGN